MPLACLLLAMILATALSVPMTRVKLINYGRSYSDSYNLLEGGLLFNIRPFNVTPAGLRAIVDGSGPTDELRALVEDVADSPDEIYHTLDPQSEMLVGVGTADVSVSDMTYYGLGLAIFNRTERVGYDQSLDENPGSLPLTVADHNLLSFWPSMTWRDESGSHSTSLATVFWVPIAIGGLCWLVFVLVSLCTSRRWVRVVSVVVVLLLLGISSQSSHSETHVSIHDRPDSLERTGVTHAEFIAAGESDEALRRLAGALLAAIPETAPDDGICYLGTRNPVFIEMEGHTLGPTYFYFGQYNSMSVYHADDQGQKLGSATWQPQPLVHALRAEPYFTVITGNTWRSLYVQTAPLLALLTLVGLVYSIPRWCFVIVANRRHRKRLRLAQCCGCGYALEGKLSGV